MKKKSKLSILVILFSVVSILRCLIWLSPAPLMNFIMEDMGLSYAQSGLLLLIVTVMMGVSLFIGSFVIDALGAGNAFTISALLLGIDGLFGFFARSFLPLIAGRVISGLGMGLSMGAMNALIAERFSKEQQSAMNSLNLILSSLGMALAYVVSLPLLNLLGTYHSVFLLWSVLMLISAVLFFLADFRTARAVRAKKSPGSERKPGLVAAARFKNVWVIAIAMAGALWVYNGFSTYLPTFLAQERMLSLEAAGAASSVMQISGIAGGLLYGVLLSRGRGAKPLLVLAVIILFAGALGTSLVPGGILLYLSVFCIGMGYYAFQTAAVTSVMQLPGMLPQTMAGATAIYTGTGSFLGLAAPYAFDALQASGGMQFAMTMFSLALIISLLSLFMYRS